MALVNYYLTDSEGESDDEEDTHVRFSPPTPVTADVPPVGPQICSVKTRSDMFSLSYVITSYVIMS